MSGAGRLAAAFVAALGLLGAPPDAGADTFVFSSGNNHGLADEAPLSFAESDARRVAEAFSTVGAAESGNITLARGLSLRSLTGTLRSLEQRTTREDTLYLFLSAHGDKHGLHINGVRTLCGQMPGRDQHAARSGTDRCPGRTSH